MTVIAWDGSTLAADRQVSCGDLRAEGRKLYRVGDVGIAFAGDASRAEALLAWWKAGADPEKWPPFQRNDAQWVLMVIADANGCRYYENEPFPVAAYGRRAFGQGREVAAGAMAAGADARRAVEIANAICSGCGFGVDAVTVRRPESVREPSPEPA